MTLICAAGVFPVRAFAASMSETKTATFAAVCAIPIVATAVNVVCGRTLNGANTISVSWTAPEQYWLALIHFCQLVDVCNHHM